MIVIGSIAYDSYLYVMKTHFRGYQTIKSIQSMHDGNTIRAIACQQNIVDTYNSNYFALLINDREKFNLEQALNSFIVKRVIESTYSEKGERSSEAIDRGRLAFLLDSIGMKSYADEEWKRATELIGYSNKDAFKEMISRIINNDLSVLTPDSIAPYLNP